MSVKINKSYENHNVILNLKEHGMYNRYNQLWSWQDEALRQSEYNGSLASLKRFLVAAEGNQPQTLEDVSALASLVGHDLTVIAATKGQETEERTGYFEPELSDSLDSIHKVYTLRIPLKGQELGVMAKEGYASISKYRLLGFQAYQSEEVKVTLPSDRDIAIGNIPNVDTQNVYAFDIRGGAGKKQYLPAVEPCNAEVQQGFIHLLRECIQELIAAMDN